VLPLQTSSTLAAWPAVGEVEYGLAVGAVDVWLIAGALVDWLPAGELEEELAGLQPVAIRITKATQNKNRRHMATPG
jgi:hypothetical protein